MSSYSASISKYETEKDGKVMYRVNYSYVSPKTHKRTRTCKRGFARKKDAEKWILNDLANVVRKLEYKEESPTFMTMEELVEEYLEDAELDEDIEATTMQTKLSNINNHILPFFKEMVVRELKPRDIKEWQREMKKKRKSNGEPYSSTYLRAVENQLSAIFNYAVLYYDLPKNPIAKRMGSKKSPEPVIWQLSMYQKFQKEIEDKIEYYYAFEVFFWTGIRLGELLALTPNDIDFDKKTINIDKSWRCVRGKQFLGPTKTEYSCRQIPVPDFLLDELREYLGSIEHYSQNNRMFTLNKTGIHKVIDKYSEIAGVPRITIHALRHSHASMIENLGFSRTVLKKRLGHAREENKDITTTYTHSYDSADFMVAKILNEVALGNIDPNNLYDKLLNSK